VSRITQTDRGVSHAPTVEVDDGQVILWPQAAN
jgi:hypothetical protein